MFRVIFVFILLLHTLFLQGQIFKLSSEEKESLSNRLYFHVAALSHDSMLGREAGTEGERMAMKYIVSQFENAGLKPFYNNDFAIPFTFSEGYTYRDECLKFGKKEYRQRVYFDYINTYVNYNFEGKLRLVGNGLRDSDYLSVVSNSNEKNVILIDVNFSDTCADAHDSKYMSLLEYAIAKASSFNPEAIILSSSNTKLFPDITSINPDAININMPIISTNGKVSKKLLKSNGKLVQSQNKFEKNERTGHNVVAWINNNSSTTVVFGAHYDHLGFHTNIFNTDTVVFNGADDNASGTALLIELSKIIQNSTFNNHNYLFIAFSAEEKGLFGSKAFLNQNLIADSTIIAMINFDMVGRMSEKESKLNILGVGTALEWDSIITSAYSGPIHINKSVSGVAGSDQMSFYLKNIPVLFFITGMHEDYHKPSDDADKINANGMAEILEIALGINEKLNGLSHLNFNRNDSSNIKRGKRQGGVSLGVIPDHAWDGEGMRIDVVFENRPAFNAGLIKEDIVIKIDDNVISDIMSYMKALSTYKNGDKAKITYLRNQIENTVEVVF